MYKWSYRRFSHDAFLSDVGKIGWSDIYDEEEPDRVLELFLNKFQPVIDNHAPIKKLMIRNCRASWIDNELKDYMTQRDEAKKTAQKTGSITDRQKYCNELQIML